MEKIVDILESYPFLAQIISLVLGTLSAFVITSLLIPEIIKISDAYNLHDQPDSRKIHVQKIPTFGGIAIFAGFIVATTFWAFSHHISNIQYLIGAIVIIVSVGMRDDFLSLRAKWKLIGQSAAAFLIIFFGDMRFFNLYGFLGIYELPLLLSWLITWFTIIVITNAFNLIDGINGLAGTVGLIVFGLYGAWFMYSENHIMVVICFSLCGAVLGFLRYNYLGKIFMGDTGSLLLGFLAAATTIVFINESSQNHLFRVQNPICIASAILVYPLFDTLRVFLIRVSQKRSPFSADRNHLHHALLALGYSHLKATGIIALASLGMIIFAMLIYWMADNIAVPLLVLGAWLLSLLLKKN